MPEESRNKSILDASTNRRRFLGGSAAAMLGLGALAGGSGVAIDEVSAQDSSKNVEKPLGWKPVNLENVDRIARENYYAGMHCAEGVFHTLVQTQREQGDNQWDEVPTTAAWWCAGGGASNGALCGTIAGGASAIALAYGRSGTTMKLVNELFQRYQQTAFPQYEPPKSDDTGLTLDLPKNRSKSPLCHVSVTKWCTVSGYAWGSKERAERCSRVAADMARMTAELLNAEARGEWASVANDVPPPSTVDPENGCTSCHSAGQPYEQGGFVQTKMACGDCHGFAPHMPSSLRSRAGGGTIPP
ncbi:MAG: C-GCAxxG-C-C family protein [Halodesulfurarchaeum sp.]